MFFHFDIICFKRNLYLNNSEFQNKMYLNQKTRPKLRDDL